METFDGRPAEAVATIPALFRTYVDRAVREHPGLNTSIEAVIGHLRADLARPSADLTDDDVNTIRATWAQTLTDAERQQRLHPVEDLAHEGWVHKRVREEGGGYRFTFQHVAEYLVYLDLRRARPAAEDELAYWTRRAAPNPVFPEYAGAFAFLLRDWARERKAGPGGADRGDVPLLVRRRPGGLPDRAGPDRAHPRPGQPPRPGHGRRPGRERRPVDGR